MFVYEKDIYRPVVCRVSAAQVSLYVNVMIIKIIKIIIVNLGGISLFEELDKLMQSVWFDCSYTLIINRSPFSNVLQKTVS